MKSPMILVILVLAVFIGASGRQEDPVQAQCDNGGGPTIPDEIVLGPAWLLRFTDTIDSIDRPSGSGCTSHTVTATSPDFCPIVSWMIEPSDRGVSIDQSGSVCIGNTACGTYTITVTDACNRTAEKRLRIGNAGTWANRTVIHSQDCGQNFPAYSCTTGTYYYFGTRACTIPEWHGGPDPCGVAAHDCSSDGPGWHAITCEVNREEWVCE